MTLLGDLTTTFGWQPSAWRVMGWRELQAWVEELGRRRREEEAAHRRRMQQAEIDRQRRHG